MYTFRPAPLFGKTSRGVGEGTPEPTSSPGAHRDSGNRIYHVAQHIVVVVSESLFRPHRMRLRDVASPSLLELAKDQDREVQDRDR